MSESSPADRRSIFERGYVATFAIAAALLSVLPNLYALMAAPPGATYQGFQWAADDHYVYAAWMRQAMEGRLLMDNRFAVDAQPGLTIHIYFFLTGLLAKLVGIPLAMAISKMGFTALFVVLAHRLIQQVTDKTYITKLALALVSLGGGIGFLVWENFGPEFERPSAIANLLAALKVPGVPNDVWQPEAFVFPSMLTNGLFMVSLCLMIGAFLSFLAAQRSWNAVLPGVLCMAALMNIHSYDVLIVTIVMVCFLAMQLSRRDVAVDWVVRAVIIGLGAVPPALWFTHVLANDPVFQERAATPTYSPNFRVLILGYTVMIAIAGLILTKDWVKKDRRKAGGAAIFSALLLSLFVFAPAPGFDGFYLSLIPWIGVFVIAITSAVLLAVPTPAANLVVAWAITGIVAPYFPALFERKLTMGLSIPWAILAAIGIGAIALNRDRSRRNLITVLTILVLGGTSLRWFFREMDLIKLNVSNTTLHSVYLSRDTQWIIEYLNDQQVSQKRTVVLALPGVANKDAELPDTFRAPIVSDLNPVISGLTGAYTFAGHWSETPKYIDRRNLATEFFLANTDNDRRIEILTIVQPDYIVAPNPNSVPGLADLGAFGQMILDGNQFQLIKVRKP